MSERKRPPGSPGAPPFAASKAAASRRLASRSMSPTSRASTPCSAIAALPMIHQGSRAALAASRTSPRAAARAAGNSGPMAQFVAYLAQQQHFLGRAGGRVLGLRHHPRRPFHHLVDDEGEDQEIDRGGDEGAVAEHR